MTKAWEGHTPGPWTADEEVPEMSGFPAQYGIYARGDIIVATGALGASNAALIAAAPSLAARVEELEAALRPFVESAKLHVADAPEWRDIDSVYAVVSIGDFRRALEVMRSP